MPASYRERDNPSRGPSPRAPLVAAVFVLVLFVVGCCAVGLAFQTGTGRGMLDSRYVVDVCVGVNTGPSFQVGLTWIAPYMSSMPPVMLQNPACALVPWPPLLPPRGGLAFPP